ncbi:MAG: hypothetical protein RIR79_713 [Pseudomonadota bacterium]|jgi:hypothetical protein
MTMKRKKLPIGIQTFSKLREGGYYYADKTGYAVDLAESATSYYFLSRPRRFGKSLFLDTLKDLFQGNQKLFEGLQAENRWDWDRKHPVIHISFSDGVLKSKAELLIRIQGVLRLNRQHLGIPLPSDWPEDDIAGNFLLLIEQSVQKTGEKVIVLIDEYDKPILDNITDRAIATDMREGLKNLYSVLKGADAHLRFVFITGVSKFSKVSLFSGLNHLQDITLIPRYSAICGYTDEDIDTVFAPELFDLDRKGIRDWYNGYNWLGESVYNPFDVLLLFENRVFDKYWFETGTPTFLVQLLSERKQFTPNLSKIIASEVLLSTFDVDNIPSEAILFQAGYLTIQSRRQVILGQWAYTLTYPNKEVEGSLNAALLPAFGISESIGFPQRVALVDTLQINDFVKLKELFHALFASIPNDWYRNNTITQFEGYYASIFYSHFAALGLNIVLEDVTNHGRIDMTVLFNQNVYIFEFKVTKTKAGANGDALQQIKDRNYADKYKSRNEPIHLIGVEFSKQNRNIVGFEVETV